MITERKLDIYCIGLLIKFQISKLESSFVPFHSASGSYAGQPKLPGPGMHYPPIAKFAILTPEKFRISIIAAHISRSRPACNAPKACYAIMSTVVSQLDSSLS